MNDLISRQEAIRLAEQGQIQGFEWQFKKLCTLPSAEPTIIRCRDCKHHDGIRCFRWNSTIITGFDDFCSNAEKRGEEDE